MNTFHSGLLAAMLIAAPALKSMSWDDGVRGSGVSNTVERPVESFSRVEVSGAVDLIIHRGPTSTAILSGDSNILDRIILEHHGDRLRIYSEGSISPKLPLQVEIATDRLVEVKASGATTVRAEDLEEEWLTVESSGASDLFLSGHVGQLTAEVSGASDLHARDLEARSVEIDCSGASDGRITVLDELDADCSGASDLEFWGTPTRTRFSTSGASEVKAHDGSYPVEDDDDEHESRRQHDAKVM